MRNTNTFIVPAGRDPYWPDFKLWKEDSALGHLEKKKKKKNCKGGKKTPNQKPKIPPNQTNNQQTKPKPKQTNATTPELKIINNTTPTTLWGSYFRRDFSLASSYTEQPALIRAAKLWKEVEFEILWLNNWKCCHCSIWVVLIYYPRGTNLPSSLQLQVMMLDSISENIYAPAFSTGLSPKASKLCYTGFFCSLFSISL